MTLRMDSSVKKIKARILNEERERYTIEIDGDEIMAIVSGKFRNQAGNRLDFPAVGDEVLVRYNPCDSRAIIEEVLPRKTTLLRKIAGEYAGAQILGSNIDIAFVLNSLNRDLNLRRIERYLVMIRDGGIRPVIVLTKSDLMQPEVVNTIVEKVRKIAGIDEIIVTSIFDQHSMEAIKALIAPEMTVALIGSSGVGKSSLSNLLLGEDIQKVQDIGTHAERGVHTTTSRSLFRLANGAYLMDTPGIREIQLWEGDSGVGSSFEDVLELISRCRFSNCTHQNDVGCAVRAAINNGVLEQSRLQSFLKIEREQSFMQARSCAKTQSQQRKIWKKRSVEARSKKKMAFG